MDNLRIHGDRMLRNFTELSEIGATGDGGVHRPALSDAHLEARRWLREKILAANLEFRTDAAGNHFGRLRCGPDGAPSLLIGSHLDSVPYGGRFDGALGVLAGLEVLETIRAAGLRLPCHLEVVDFTDEEGTLVGLLGSRALAGTLTDADLENPRGGRAALRAAFDHAGIANPPAAARDPATLAGYLELHIEQGARLTNTGADIGIVTALVGIGSFALAFRGRADHAGTTAMDARRDAGLGAAQLMVRAHALAIERYPGAVINFGQAEFLPGAYNIVPATASLSLEYRAESQERLDALERDLLQLARAIATDLDLELQTHRQGCVSPAPCSPDVRKAFSTACDALDFRAVDLVSGAGHDTQAMAAVCPAGMIFIPSIGGSHNPGEFAEDGDCENGANVLLYAVLSGWFGRQTG
ncbi:MAG TPA: Zn-dependent hydrolase [Anaerolineales bacterium]|nr:Zn-dependent hydrolase [Anaerolineales bacterium]